MWGGMYRSVHYWTGVSAGSAFPINSVEVMAESLCCLCYVSDLLIKRKGGNFEWIKWLMMFLEHSELCFSVVVLSYRCIGECRAPGPLGSEVHKNLFLSLEWIPLQLIQSDTSKEVYRLTFVIAVIYPGNTFLVVAVPLSKPGVKRGFACWWAASFNFSCVSWFRGTDFHGCLLGKEEWRRKHHHYTSSSGTACWPWA